MEKHHYQLVLILSLVSSLGLVSFVSCIAAEIKRTKAKELKLVGKLCHLPESHAFGFGIAALICLFIAQMIANLIVFGTYFCSREKKQKKMSSTTSKPKQAKIFRALLFISWVSFVMAVTLIGTAASMSRKQTYGVGWLHGECYLVKPGIYVGSGVLVLITIGSTLCLIITTMTNKSQVDEKGFNVKEQSKLNTKL